MGKKKVGNPLRLPPQARTEKGRLTPAPEGSRGKGLKPQTSIGYLLLRFPVPTEKSEKMPVPFFTILLTTPVLEEA
jgi:hypothetical protein